MTQTSFSFMHATSYLDREISRRSQMHRSWVLRTKNFIVEAAGLLNESSSQVNLA